MNRAEAEILLKKTFLHDKFFDNQWKAIERLLDGLRVLMIEKTGFGKSLCFQFPAIIFPGTTVIFSPLIALMRDQVKKLEEIGIAAKCINSEQTNEQNAQVINDAINGKIKILYIAPERQENLDWLEAARSMNISMAVIDEAHCISVWGHDFRPSYRRIVNLVNLFPKGLPVLATTATATKQVQDDVAEQIGGSISVIRGNLMRENFRLFVIKVNSENEKMIWLGQNLDKIPGSGIIYTGTRVDTEIYSRWLDSLKIPSVSYNAGLSPDSRIEIEKGLMDNRWKCIVSTNALGMGIDKPDIRFIIHTQIPQSPIHYYQEIGRAGRDGKISYIILFYGPDDKELPEAFIENAKPNPAKYDKVIKAVKSQLLGESEIISAANLRKTQTRVILADLIEQGIIREVYSGRKKQYEFIPKSKPLNTEPFYALRDQKLDELDKMLGYVNTDISRMKYLCDYLGDNSESNYNNCDNTKYKKRTVKSNPEWQNKINIFHDNYFPVLELKSKNSNLTNGVAASYYGISNVGKVIHRSKYENGGDFPDFLIKMVLGAIKKKFCDEAFDLILYVPPTKSGNLVKNFALKLSLDLKIPVSHSLLKCRPTEEQKVFENFLLKSKNIGNAFTYKNPEEIKAKKILLVDDVCDSGATLKEIGNFLTASGALKITPVVIAKTVGGDIS